MKHSKFSMKLLIIVAFLTLAAAREIPAVVDIAETTAYDYHAKLGIAQARRIRAIEEESILDAGRLAGGSDAAAGEHPFLVGLVVELNNGFFSVCSASMLSNERAVTAAHCWWDGGNQARVFELVFGSRRLFYGGTRVNSSDVQMHASWNPNNTNNDIAIITFPYVAYSNVIHNVPLATGTATYAGEWAQAAGYGQRGDSINYCIDQDQVKSHLTLQVITNAVCQQTFGAAYVVASNICTSGAGGVGACNGDSGGPLTSMANNQRVLIGVISYAPLIGCQRNQPTVHVRITSFVAWINARM